MVECQAPVFTQVKWAGQRETVVARVRKVGLSGRNPNSFSCGLSGTFQKGRRLTGSDRRDGEGFAFEYRSANRFFSFTSRYIYTSTGLRDTTTPVSLKATNAEKDAPGAATSQ